ncbi:MAG: radical SAM protein [Anaerolineae bacterium]|nr:radical SAM protein [Anaerolineae bacterium]
MKRVLLVISPETQVKDPKQTGSKWPRIGIAYIAAYLRAHMPEGRLAIQVLDCKALELDHDAIASRIRTFQPHFVGLGPFTEEIYDAYQVCRTAKEIDAGIVTVFGGPHASALPERTLCEFPDLDVVVYGEGEGPFLQLVQGVDRHQINGIAYRRKGADPAILVNEPAEQIHDIDTLPYPAWDLFPLDAYRGILTRHLREKVNKSVLELPILSARGCPFHCNFCYKTCQGLRNRDPVKIVDELEYDMQRFGATEFFFVEGTFAASPEQGLHICDEIIDRGLAEKIRWIVETRVNVVNKELLCRMKDAGCTQVDFGVESGDEEILKNTRKGITIEQVKRAVASAKQAGLQVGCYFIIGHPNETKESIKKTYKLARELDPDLMNVGIMIPYPGTIVRDMAEKGEGGYRLLSKDWSEYTKQRGGPLELNTLSLKELQRIQSREYIKYYIRPNKVRFILKNFSFDKILKIVISLFQAAVVGRTE